MNKQADFWPASIDTGAPTAELMAETDFVWLWRKLAETRFTRAEAVAEQGRPVVRPRRLREVGAL